MQIPEVQTHLEFKPLLEDWFLDSKYTINGAHPKNPRPPTFPLLELRRERQRSNKMVISKQNGYLPTMKPALFERFNNDVYLGSRLTYCLPPADITNKT